MRIAFTLTRASDVGGVERQAHSVARALLDAGHEVHFFAQKRDASVDERIVFDKELTVDDPAQPIDISVEGGQILTLEVLEVLTMLYEAHEEWHIISQLLTTKLGFSYIFLQMIGINCADNNTADACVAEIKP